MCLSISHNRESRQGEGGPRLAQLPIHAGVSTGEPPVKYGVMDGFSELLSPGACKGGIDLQDCFLRWSVSPSCRRYLGVRRPVSSVLGVYLFAPFGLGPSPGWNDFCVKVVLKAACARIPSLRAAAFVGDPRLVDVSGERDPLLVPTSGLMSFFDDLGAKYRAKEGMWRRPTCSGSWLGFVADAHQGDVKMEEKKGERALCLR